ncbi:MAG: efflux RND transporter permease subunit [Candidatus Kaiserbacteria bacterium]|nr:efflux RND transporter permease subunit [Candidatus Kaiserbacteria bacterium]
MHSLWFFFLRKREFSLLLILALMGVGIYSLFAISKESAPEVIVPIGIVSTFYPGASALDVEELITNKLERTIGNVEDLDTLTSTSRDGASTIIAQFDAKADIDKSIQNLKDAVDTAKGDLPDDATDPHVTKLNFVDQPILVLSVSSDLSPTEFTDLAETVADEFKNVRGVSDVAIEGTRPHQVQVIVRESALSAYKLRLSDVTRALALANLTIPVGTVVTDGVEYAVRYEGSIDDVSKIESIPVSLTGAVPVYVRDVAVVKNSVERESSISRVSVDGKPSETAFTLSIFKRSGVDVTVMSSAVITKLDEMKKPDGLLASSQVLVVFDQGANVQKDLSDLITTGVETVLLVILCLLLTIGWRESLVAALSIPLSFVIAFIGLYASGNTINFISLFSLILAVGILVDSGIVITEAIHTRMLKYGNADEAAKAAIKEYAWPLIGGTMTTVAVFAPLFFLSGIVGQFIKSIPFTIIFVLLASIIVALGMVPLIAVYLTKHSHSNKFEALQEEYTHRAQAWYRMKLVAFLKNFRAQRLFFIALGVGFLLVFILPFSGMLKVIFFPPEDVDYVFVEVESKQGTTLAETDLALRTFEEMLYEKPYIESFTSTAGAGSAFTGSSNSGAKFANITITLKTPRSIPSDEISADLRESFSVVKSIDAKVVEMQNGPPSGAPVSLQFIGDDLGALALAVERAGTLLESIQGTRDVTLSTNNNATELILEVDRDKASSAHVSPATIGEVLRSAVFGITATTITHNGEDIDIVAKIEVDPNEKDFSASPSITIDTLRNLTVPSVTGAPVLLGSIVTERLAPANANIAHEDQERIETVTAYTEDGVTSAEVVSEFKNRQSELALPEGVRISYGGEAEDINKSFTEMGLAFVAGLVLMLAILVLAFNSIRYSIYLLLAVPLSLIGVFSGLAMTGQALSFTSLLGVIALAGVIINHAIILMDSMIHFRDTRQVSDELIDVVADASVSRLRPIFLTTITTVVGMIPLSTISDFWSPLAFAIMFGLSFAMILTLVLVPTLFYRHEKKLLEKKLLGDSTQRTV